MRTGVSVSGTRVIGPANPPPVLTGQKPGKRFSAPRQHADSSWPPNHVMLARVALLEQAPAFFGLPERTLRSLARRLRRITLGSGEAVVYQGEPGDSIFFIEHGRCRVMIERPPSVVTVAVLSEADFFGEAACLMNRPQQASVFAQTECTLYALDRQALHAVLGRDGELFDQLRTLAEQRFNLFADTAVQATWGMLLGEATVVGLYSPKGGSGGTCLALNLVGRLSRLYPGQVLLLDLDFPYSHAALLAGLVPTSCLARLAGVPPDSFEEVLLSSILYHAGGPMILPGALRPEESDAVTAELIARAIAILRKTFRYVVVDLGIAIDDSTLAVLDLTQHVVLVAAPELSAVKSAADAIEILQKLGTPDDRLTVVLNNRTPKPAVSKPAVERMLKRSVDVEVSFDGAKPDQAALTGKILSLTDPKSEITRGAQALADILEEKHGTGKQRHAQAEHSATGAGDC
ncbi:MAG TPA: cyclic nucleotide-binding domain-containing protein [Candidatus Dormibacteraeota bacterium]|jgi:MinD-like ATPase involved in chromosome partitioning or flagellar assembly|nr:cyclic nucleotide-binding domain-containing protein [Candidatus Dormibacteraeota bacterium]